MALSTAQKSILIVEDEEVLRESLAKSLKKEGFEVTTSPDGKTAQTLAAIEGFDLILSDIHMPGSPVSGIELLRYAKEQCKTPVILMTGFANLSETQEAHSMGAAGFLAKPFKKEELVALIRKLTHVEAPDAGGAPGERDEDYCKVGIDDFISGRAIKFDIFIRLSQNKFVKIAHQGEDLSSERIRVYQNKGIRFLYLRSGDFREYLQFNLVLGKAVKASTKLDPAKKLHLMKHANEVILEHFHQNGLDSHSFEDAKAIVDSTLGVLSEQKETMSLLDALNSHSDALYAHSLGVSLYSSLLARHLKWDSPQTLYKLSIAGLLHDIGKREIDRAVLNKSRAELTMDEVKLIESHSARGVEILSKVPGFSTDIMQVVLQHHENCSGTGYPAKITKNRIQPLARLLAVCDEFCDLVVAGPEHERMQPAEAIQRLVVLFGETLDQAYVLTLAGLFNIDTSPWVKQAGRKLGA